MAALSPADRSHGDLSPDVGNHVYSSDEANNSNMSPLHNYGIFNGNNVEKKLKADGTEPKRRGPKPDSKPALNRRQELNRQAQRTHRERKELYIKALEQEVLRLKDTYGTACRDRDAFKEKYRRLCELLKQHNIPFPADLNLDPLDSLKPSLSSETSSGSFSGTYDVDSMDSESSPMTDVNLMLGAANGNSVAAPPEYDIDVDQVGINFVLALERPCMDHMQMLCVKSQTMEDQFSGHALMATCPPVEHIIHHPGIQYPHEPSEDVSSGDLLKLLDLSARLPLDGGEITPVMAWAYIFRDARFRQLSEEDILTINSDLMAKVRCYGFGAVIEEFEVKDSLENLLAHKMESLTIAA